MKTLDQHLAETGRQGLLDKIRATPGYYEKAAKIYRETGKVALPRTEKFFNQYFAESGKQGVLDKIRAMPGEYNKALNAYMSGKTYTLPQSGQVAQPPQYAQPTAQPDPVNQYLNNYQKQVSQVKLPPIQSPEQIKAQLNSGMSKPKPLDRQAMDEALNKQYGTAELEQQVNDLNSQEQDVLATLRQQKAKQNSAGILGSVAAGRISEFTRQAQEKLDFIGRQKQTLTNELNTKYNIINHKMQLAGLDYQDAMQQYDMEYKQNLQVYNIISQQQQAQQKAIESNRSYNLNVAKFQYQVATNERNAALSNLTVMANSVVKGNLNYSNLDSNTKMMITKLETQSGLPVGYIQSLGLSAKDKVISMNNNTGQAFIVDDSGNYKLINTGMTSGSGSGGLTQSQVRSYTSDAIKIISNIDANYRDIGGKVQDISNTLDSNLNKPQGDTYLSSAEADLALKQVIAKVGDEALGRKIFTNAWKNGGFKPWRP